MRRVTNLLAVATCITALASAALWQATAEGNPERGADDGKTSWSFEANCSYKCGPTGVCQTKCGTGIVLASDKVSAELLATLKFQDEVKAQNPGAIILSLTVKVKLGAKKDIESEGSNSCCGKGCRQTCKCRTHIDYCENNCGCNGKWQGFECRKTTKLCGCTKNESARAVQAKLYKWTGWAWLYKNLPGGKRTEITVNGSGFTHALFPEQAAAFADNQFQGQLQSYFKAGWQLDRSQVKAVPAD